MLRLCKLLTFVKILLFSTREFLCHVQSTETYASVNSNRVQSPPRATAEHLPAFLSREWCICKFCAARGPGICQPRGYSRAFDTRAVSYQNITTQRILLEKRRLAHLSRTGCCKDVFSILSMHFFIAYEARIS